MARGLVQSLLSTMTCYLSLRVCTWKGNIWKHLKSSIWWNPNPVMQAGPNVAATITAHHLCHNRNATRLWCDTLFHLPRAFSLWHESRDAKAIFKGGINPHYYCLPILKTEQDRLKLVQCAVENSKFFLGTDSAAHTVGKKECACGCAGCFTAHMSIELVAEAFEPCFFLEIFGALWNMTRLTLMCFNVF